MDAGRRPAWEGEAGELLCGGVEGSAHRWLAAGCKGYL